MNKAIVAPRRGDSLDVIAQVNKGQIVADLDDAIKEAVQTSMETGRASVLTIELKITPDSKTEMIRVAGKLKKKLPEQPTKEAMFYPSPDGGLSRYDARQGHMFPSADDKE